MVTDEGTRFAQKVDWWIWALVAGLAAEMVWVGYMGIRDRQAMAVVIGAGTTGIVLAILLPALVNGYCLLTDDFLSMRIGLFFVRIRCDDILLVEETHNPISSMAFSLDRLGIEYRSGGTKSYMLIALRDKEGFFAALQMKNPAIVIKRRQKRRKD